MIREIRVWAMDPVRRVMTLRHTTTELAEACQLAAALRQKGLRVQVNTRYRTVPVITPARFNESWRHRHAAAGQMLDRNDAAKRYKSMG